MLEGRFSGNPQALEVLNRTDSGLGSRKELYSVLVRN
jgi:hypothetical protein